MNKYKYRYDIDYFNLIDNAEKAYWLGFLYADGSVTEIKKKKFSKFYDTRYFVKAR